MSEKKKDGEQKKKPIPAPPTKIEEADRLLLAEKFFRMASLRNAVVALRSDLNGLETKAELIQSQKELTNNRMSQINEELGTLNQEWEVFLKEFKEERGIPPHMEINVDDGSVFQRPPQPGQPIQPRIIPDQGAPRN
jgi:hypothetical protein